MPSWDKLLLACMSIIYFIFLADFISRSKEDALSPIEQCGLLEKVEYANRTRRSELAVMLHLKAEGSSNPTKIRFRNDKTPTNTYEMLKRIPASDVCVSTVASPILGFLKYPIQVRSIGGELYFQANMRSTYLDSKPYIFWFFVIPVSFALAKLLNGWASRKREKCITNRSNRSRWSLGQPKRCAYLPALCGALKVFLTMDKGVLFKQVWRGWFVGVSVLFTPILLLVALFAPEAPPQMAFGVLMVPVVAAFQGVIVGGLVLLGVTIWPLKAGKSG